MESIQPILQSVHQASVQTRQLTDEQKQHLLLDIAKNIDDHIDVIVGENSKDLARMDDGDPKKDRLLLNPARLKDIAQSVRDVAQLEDPTGKLLYTHVAENGLKIERITAPMGVVGVIYESRPNVTIDVVALCLRAGNAVILRGGSDAEASNKILVNLVHQALSKNGLFTEMVQLLPTDRKFVKELLEADKYVDIIIPRGSQTLINFVRDNSRVPTIETGAGVCHTFVDSYADLYKAAQIVINAKTHRPSVCNALDTIIIHSKIAEKFIPLLKEGLASFGVEVFADEFSYPIFLSNGFSHLQHAGDESFGMEYLSQKCSVKVVSDIEEALAHIRKYSSKHSEAIVSENNEHIVKFLNEVDAAAVYANASTRFTDGGVFGLGAEIGISTQKLHARGPFALEKLTTEKWIIHGNGQIR